MKATSKVPGNALQELHTVESAPNDPVVNRGQRGTHRLRVLSVQSDSESVIMNSGAVETATHCG